MESLRIRFEKVKLAYAELERTLKKGKGLVYKTEKGIYGTTDVDAIFKFFQDIHLETCKSFIDLGCGDGRVVLIASLFTKAKGIEFDSELIEKAKEIRDSLGMKCDLLRGDYMKQDISDCDVVFMNPDHEFHDIDDKLKRELKGTLYIYNEIFAPNLLKKGKKFWPSQVPIITYTSK